MTSTGAPVSPSVRAKVSTGYGRLDEALGGGFLAGSMILLNAPASSEVPHLERKFLESGAEGSLLVCTTLSSAENIMTESSAKALVCSDKPVSPAKNIMIRS